MCVEDKVMSVEDKMKDKAVAEENCMPVGEERTEQAAIETMPAVGTVHDTALAGVGKGFACRVVYRVVGTVLLQLHVKPGWAQNAGTPQ